MYQRSLGHRPGLATEAGEFYVGAKTGWRSWTPTPGMIEHEPENYSKHADGLEGKPDNPLRARALYLFQEGRGDTFLRIHGTNDPETIGRAVSNGCAGLTNKHIMRHYEQVPMSTRVVLYPKMSPDAFTPGQVTALRLLPSQSGSDRSLGPVHRRMASKMQDDALSVLGRRNVYRPARPLHRGGDDRQAQPAAHDRSAASPDEAIRRPCPGVIRNAGSCVSHRQMALLLRAVRCHPKRTAIGVGKDRVLDHVPQG